VFVTQCLEPSLHRTRATPATAPVWDDLRVLLAVHRGKSFLCASKALGVATSTVARRIEAFERALGRPLVLSGNRGTAIDADAPSLIALASRWSSGLTPSSVRRMHRRSTISTPSRSALTLTRLTSSRLALLPNQWTHLRPNGSNCPYSVCVGTHLDCEGDVPLSALPHSRSASGAGPPYPRLQPADGAFELKPADPSPRATRFLPVPGCAQAWVICLFVAHLPIYPRN
jgi:Bacterial regulatory helix-turn-helix protein, lysR family